MLVCLVSLGICISFRRVNFIPCSALERVLAFDTDHDGRMNLIFDDNPPNYNLITIWEYNDYDQYSLEDSVQSPVHWAPAIYDVGYLDSDSLVDMVGNHNAVWPYPLYVYESPNYNSNPTNIVWQDSGFGNIYGSYITDLDQDGMHEILFSYSSRTCVYENIGDNQYSLVWQDTARSLDYGVVGDFDLDGNSDFARVKGIVVWECIGNDQYEVVYSEERTPGDYIFSANDMDGNGKPEILVSCVSWFYGHTWLYCYETVGDNNYERFLIDSVTNLPPSIWLARSACGDIDADGVEEIVWGTFNSWHVYKATGVHQYQKICDCGIGNSTATMMNVCDLNGNGYPEVIESGFFTVIWEIEGVRLKTFSGYDIYHPGEVHPIIWEKFDPPGADSFSIFFSADSGLTYDTIVTGLGSDDTVYMWRIPDVISENCKIMIWAYGPPRPGEDRPRGIAWGISLNVFAIRPQTGIDTDMRYQIGDMSLKILQNPLVSDNLKIQYALPRPSKVKLVIYNVLGQVEEVLVDGEKNMGLYEVELKKSLPGGVYFIKLVTDKKTITKKCVVLRN